MTPDEYLKEIGEKVKCIRTLKHVSLSQLSEMCKLPYTFLSDFENGKEDIDICTLISIAKNLRVEVKEILQGFN